MSELLAALVSEFAGQAPDVPFAPGVDVAGIQQDDPDPMFVTLPVCEIGAKSENGFTWGAQDVQRVIEEINSKRPEGIVGHVPLEERHHRYDLPKLRWVGATLVGNKAWAKAYVPTYAVDAREYFRVAKRTNARVGTSVYGRPGPRGLADMTLESIDLGHPDRLGYRAGAVVPHITSEMEGNTMPENNDQTALIAELRNDRATLRALVSELRLEGADPLVAAKSLVSELAGLRQKSGVLDTLVTELALDAEKPEASAKALVAELAGHRQAALVSEVDALIAEMVQENEALRPYIREYVIERDAQGRERVTYPTKDAAQTRIKGLLESDLMKNLAQTLVSEQRGPNAFVAGKGKGGDEDWREAAVQAGYEKARSMGFGANGRNS